MIKRMMLLILVSLTLSVFANETKPYDQVEFFYGSLKEAKALAGAEGKLSFVEFHASWCGPCKWMDKTTFVDPSVIKKLNDNYISVKVDIDDFDGFAWKQQYNIEMLPTMLIFNSKGELVERIEETLSASKLVKILEMHNSDFNKEVVRSFNTSPREVLSQKQKIRDKNFSKVDFSRRSQSSFKIQLGIYEDYQEALEYYNDLKEEFLEPIIVLNDYSNGTTRYKIMMGDFQTENEAHSFRDILENDYSINGFVQ